MYTLFCELLKVPEFPLLEDNILPFIKYLALEIRLKQSSIKVKIINIKKKKNKKNIHKIQVCDSTSFKKIGCIKY